MSLLQSVLLGLIQGLTEFLPVSSSGHLAIFKQFFQIETGGMFFDILLHIGTLIAVFIIYYKDIFRMIKEGFAIIGDSFVNVATFFKRVITKEDLPYRKIVHNSYRKFVMLVIVSTIPTGIIGIAAKDLVSAAEQILLVPGICLIITAVLLFIADRIPDGGKTPKPVSYTHLDDGGSSNTGFFKKIFHKLPFKDSEDVTEEEIISMVNEGHEQGRCV